MVGPTPFKVVYDEDLDILEIFFQEPKAALTVELAEDTYAHIIPDENDENKIIGLTIHHFRAHHANSRFPFQGVLNPSSPRVAADIEKALQPTGRL